jgi:hypothetical protein
MRRTVRGNKQISSNTIATVQGPRSTNLCRVRYAKDFVLGFQHRADAVRYLEESAEGLGEVRPGTPLGNDSLIEFGRYAAQKRKRRRKGRVETFKLLTEFFVGKGKPGGEPNRTPRFRMRVALQSQRAGCVAALARDLNLLVSAVPTGISAIRLTGRNVTTTWDVRALCFFLICRSLICHCSLLLLKSPSRSHGVKWCDWLSPPRTRQYDKCN